jgi:transcription initiation factor TFIID TATA-box-binding protein
MSAGPPPLLPKTELDTNVVPIPPKEELKEESPEVDIVINNVVCSFSVRCHLNLKEIALNGSNVEYRRENGMVTMKLRHPYTTASIWSSGKITCTGANSEDQARVSARKFSRILQRLDEKYKNIRIKNWRIVNVLGTCTLPFAIKITPFSQAFREASYEPELHPGVTYKIKYPKATLKIFSTGSITVTAPSVANVESAIKHIYPKVFDFQKKKEITDVKKPIIIPEISSVKRKNVVQNGYKIKKPNIGLNDDSEDADELSD